VLRQIGGVISTSFRQADVYGRLGGEEFAVLLPNTSLETARDIAEQLIKAISGLASEPVHGLTASLGVASTHAQDQDLHGLINTARSQPRQCGTQAFTATTPLSWNEDLASAANSHTRNMANGNFFDHLDHDGRTPGDRAELAGYIAKNIGENIAAGLDTPRKVVDGWLASPAHCANLMNPQFRELGAAYAMDPKSDAGIYWTGVFGAQ
jgi:uncharacterized protein YkwD